MGQMTGRTVLVTGATDGIGKQTALELAALGATVIVHGRSAEKTGKVAADIGAQVPGAKVETAAADLASLKAVRGLAEEINTRFPELHVLINNAGVFVHDRVLTEDGFESTFHVNHLAPFLLTHLLLEKLKASAPARVINVSSIAHTRGRLDFGNLNGEVSHEGYAAYAMSKLCNVYFTQVLAAELRGSGVTANSLHPGVIKTKLLKTGFGTDGGASVREGARTSVYLASSPEVEGVSGKYFVDAQEAPARRDDGAARRLWEESWRMVGV